jgi:FkbM family methyltransferase
MKRNKLTQKIRYWVGRIMIRLWGFKNKKSYAGLNEDNIIDWLTGYKEKGTYIDIGANIPNTINNTKLFYERGWSGINIEPSTYEYNLLVEHRKRDKNYNVAIGCGGTIDFWESIDSSMISTCNWEQARYMGIKKNREIPLKPLKEIFIENNLTYVDFISIDVEEFEDEVLRSNDWNKYKAGVICLECIWGWSYPYLEQFGYKRVFWDGLNVYYKLA